MRIVDIFTVTYPPDYQWLPFLFRSVEKYVTGLRHLVLLIEQKHAEPDNLPPYVVVKRCRNFGPNGRCDGQPVEKLAVHEYTDADYVMYVDSDCVFIAPVDMQTFSHPLLCRQWEKAPDAMAAYFDPLHELLEFVPPFETMCRFPFFYPVDFVREVYEYVGGRERMLALAEEGMPNVCEFSALGNYAIVKCPHRFDIVRADLYEEPPLVIRQFWSHGGISAEVKAEMEKHGLRC